MTYALRWIRNRFIAAGFAAFVWSLRAKHFVLGLFRPSICRVDHVTIPVRDLAVAERFYCDILGAEHMMTIDEAALRKFGRPPAMNGGDGVFHVSLCLGGSTRVDLFLQATGQASPERGHPHYAFYVSPSDMLAWWRLLEERGIPTEGPLQLGFPGQASLYFNDPSGNHLEIVCHGLAEEIPVRAPVMSRLIWSADEWSATDANPTSAPSANGEPNASWTRAARSFRRRR